MADNLEVFEALEEEIDIDSEVEVQEYEEVKDYDDFEEKIYCRRLHRFGQCWPNENYEKFYLLKVFIISPCYTTKPYSCYNHYQMRQMHSW